MNLALLTTEIVTLILAVFIAVMDLLIPEKESRRGLGYLTVLGLIGIFGHTFTQYGINAATYKGMFVVDNYAVFFKQLFLTAFILTALFSFDYVDRLPRYRGEFYAMLVFILLGMMVMASANDLLTLFVGMELMTITFFILVGYHLGNGASSEAGIKYLILGASSTAVLLYGISLVYGLTGTVVLPEIMARLAPGPAAVLGVSFILAGFAFKIAAVPFHMWAPDIYEGAPVPVTALLAMASKAAGFAALVRTFAIAFPGLGENWLAPMAFLAAISMIFGNITAIPQTNIKRMLAYSSIAQAGYMLAGLLAVNPDGVKSILFYAMLYVFANIGAFAVITVVNAHRGSDNIADYAGLAQKSPLLALVMTVALLSMAGIPPLAGFAGKLYLFTAVVEQGYLWLALLGFVMSMVSVYYYLVVAKVMYMSDPADNEPMTVSEPIKIAALVSMALTLFFGVYPGPLSGLAAAAARSLL